MYVREYVCVCITYYLLCKTGATVNHWLLDFTCLE